MLYALLCSIALRPVKEWAVAQLDRSLADPRRSVLGALGALAALPLTALKDAWEEGRGVAAKWRQAVQEEFARRQAQIKRGTATSPRTPRTAAAAAAAATPGVAPSAMPSLAVYGHAAVKVLKSRRTSKKRRRARQALRRGHDGGSSLLFRWLFRAVAAWLLWEWVRDSWSATVQLVLLVFTAVVALGLVPLLLLTTNRYLGAAMFSPVKTPTASAARVRLPCCGLPCACPVCRRPLPPPPCPPTAAASHGGEPAQAAQQPAAGVAPQAALLHPLFRRQRRRRRHAGRRHT